MRYEAEESLAALSQSQHAQHELESECSELRLRLAETSHELDESLRKLAESEELQITASAWGAALHEDQNSFASELEDLRKADEDSVISQVIYRYDIKAFF